MPSTMIHLLTAHEINPKGEGLFWIGNFAPDYTNDRAFKDQIHFRNASNRMEALSRFKKVINNEDPFESGWLVHLFVDACWDEMMIPAFEQKYRESREGQQWFAKYREEIGLASYHLYHHLDWTPHIWDQILKTDLSLLISDLPITKHEIQWFRDRVYRKHSESHLSSVSLEYNKEQLLDFARKTALKYMEWI